MPFLQVLNEADYPAVWQIFHEVFEHKYITEFHVAWSARNKDLSFGLFDEQRILVGFLLTKQMTEKHQQIEFIGVSPRIQKGGIGTHLLRKILEDSKESRYMVTLIPVNDERIIGWYKKHGFENYGEPRTSPYTGDLEQVMIYTIQSSGRQTNS